MCVCVCLCARLSVRKSNLLEVAAISEYVSAIQPGGNIFLDIISLDFTKVLFSGYGVIWHTLNTLVTLHRLPGRQICLW